MPRNLHDIEVPKNSALGIILCVVGFLIAFGLVRQIWWLVIVASFGAIGALTARGFVRDSERIIAAHEVEREHRRWLAVIAATLPMPREHELEAANAGRAAHPLMEAAE
jgi:cytochrome o ubiquinol oxidase subunit I